MFLDLINWKHCAEICQKRIYLSMNKINNDKLAVVIKGTGVLQIFSNYLLRHSLVTLGNAFIHSHLDYADIFMTSQTI